jgi:hypothetical protein
VPHTGRVLSKVVSLSQRNNAQVASDFLASSSSDDDEQMNTKKSMSYQQPQTENKLSRPERKALERQKKQRQQNPRKKIKTKYNLNSGAVSALTEKSNAEDVIKAIKRAQNTHDRHDLRVIADFLIDECDVGFAYGYRGSLLARLAVAALHFEYHDVARRAVEIRRMEYRASMLPMESAAIIRGLLRVHNATDALEVLHDELSLPLEVSLLFVRLLTIMSFLCDGESYNACIIPNV